MAVGDEVFILDLRRADGSRFVTSVGETSGIAKARMRHKAVAGQVSHWKRTLQVFHPVSPETNEHLTRDWQMAERFSL